MSAEATEITRLVRMTEENAMLSATVNIACQQHRDYASSRPPAKCAKGSGPFAHFAGRQSDGIVNQRGHSSLVRNGRRSAKWTDGESPLRSTFAGRQSDGIGSRSQREAPRCLELPRRAAERAPHARVSAQGARQGAWGLRSVGGFRRSAERRNKKQRRRLPRAGRRA